MNSSTGRSENDVYAFQGTAGQLLTAEVLSFSLRQRIADPVDSIVRVYGPRENGTFGLLNFYGRDAENDDGIDNQDPLLQDVRLPETGTYYVVVDTFAASAATDFDTGGYELLLYTYGGLPAAGSPVGGGDSVIGGAGGDILIGSTGNDRLIGSVDDGDTFRGATPDDVQATHWTRSPRSRRS